MPQTFIFFGRSGSGKGTQAKLLKDYLEKQEPDTRVLYIETGERIRSFMYENGYTSGVVKEVIDKGGLLPEFLPIWIWTDYLIRNFTGKEHMILGGLSRRVSEAPVLDSALKFYNRERPIVVLLDVSRDWSKERLINRKRKDDNMLDINARLDWYDTNVVPTLAFFRDNPNYKFVTVNGEKSIEDVHKDIVSSMSS